MQTENDSLAVFHRELEEAQGALFTWLMILLKGDEDAVWEVLQETNLFLCHETRRWRREDCSLLAWGRGVARMQAKKFLLARRRREDRFLLSSDEAEKAWDSLSLSLHESGGASVKLSALRHCVSQLSKDDRRLLLEHYGKKTPLKELAAQGNEAALAVHLMRLRRALRECILDAECRLRSGELELPDEKLSPAQDFEMHCFLLFAAREEKAARMKRHARRVLRLRKIAVPLGVAAAFAAVVSFAAIGHFNSKKTEKQSSGIMPESSQEQQMNMKSAATVLSLAAAIPSLSAATLSPGEFVPKSELNQYKLVYDYNIPSALNHKGYYANEVLYNTNISKNIAKGGFSRVAYWMELGKSDGTSEWIWLSLDAFTDDATKLGVPTRNTDAFFYGKVSNIRVWSNCERITNRNGTVIPEGNIEFWPYGYDRYHNESMNEFGGDENGNAYDWNDHPVVDDSKTYGSMQIHDYKNKEVLFSFSRFETGGKQCVGIGTNPDTSKAPDWTEVYNADSYSTRHMQIYVLEDGTSAPAPELLSATTRNAGTEIVLSFSSAVAATQNFASLISVTGADVRSIYRDPDEYSKVIVSLPTAISGNVSVTAQGVVDASPRKNMMASAKTVSVSGADQPAEVVANVPAELREGYDVIYSYEMPTTGIFTALPSGQASGPQYGFRRTSYPATFDRIAFYMEIVGFDMTTNWVWTSMDAFTQDLSNIGVPVSAATSMTVDVNNMDVAFNNAQGLTAGRNLSGGSVNFSYSGYVMEVLQNGNTCWTYNHFQSWSSHWTWCGIGVNNTGKGSATWRDGGENYISNTRKRRIYAFVKPAATEVVTPAPSALLSKVGEAKDYSLLYTFDLPVNGMRTHVEGQYEKFVTDNSEAFADKSFSRVGYYFELTKTDGTVQWAWASFDAFSQELEQYAISTNRNTATRVANLNVRSNVSGVRTGDGIQTGSIQFFAGTPGRAPTLGLPDAASNRYNFDNSCAATSFSGWGSFEVNDWGRQQPVFAIHGFTRPQADNNLAFGIGPCNSTTKPLFNSGSSAEENWIFSGNGSIYTSRKLYVLVKVGAAPATLPQYLYTIAESGGKRACVEFATTVTPALLDPKAYEVYPSVNILSAELSPVDSREVILTFAEELAANTTYTMANIASANAITAEPRKTYNRQFSLPDESVPSVVEVEERGDYTLLAKFPILSANSAVGTYGAKYSLDKSRFDNISFDRAAYVLHLVETGGAERWVWASMDAFTDDASKLGPPCVRRANTWQCYVDNLSVRHGYTGDTVPDLTDGDYAQGNIEFFMNSYGAGNAKNIPDASGSIYDFGDNNSGGSSQGGEYCSLQVHSYLAKQTVLAVNTLGGNSSWGALTVPTLGIGSRPSTDAGYHGSDWTTWDYRNAGNFTTKDLYIFVRPDASDSPVFSIDLAASKRIAAKTELTFTVLSPSAVSYQWRKDGEAIAGATGTTFSVPTTSVGEAVYDVIATDAVGRTGASTPCKVEVYGQGTVISLI